MITQYAVLDEGGAWELVQGKTTDEPGIDVWIHYWQIGSPRWGAIESNKGFDDMPKAPSGDTDKYVGGDYLLRKGSSFYLKDTQGYSKIEIEGISTDRPQNLKILEFLPKFEHAVVPAQ